MCVTLHSEDKDSSERWRLSPAHITAAVEAAVGGRVMLLLLLLLLLLPLLRRHCPPPIPPYPAMLDSASPPLKTADLPPKMLPLQRFFPATEPLRAHSAALASQGDL